MVFNLINTVYPLSDVHGDQSLFNAEDALSGLLNVVIVIVVVNFQRVPLNLLIETTTRGLIESTNDAAKHLYYPAQLLIMMR